MRGTDFPQIGYGIFAVNGEMWRAQRALASHMFRSLPMRAMGATFHRHVDKLESLLAVVAREHSVIDLQDVFMRLTLDSIGEVAFGCDIDSLTTPRQEFARAFDWLQVETDLRAFNPFRKFVTWWSYRRNLATVDRFVHELIARRGERSPRKDDNNSDFLGMVMDDETNDPVRLYVYNAQAAYLA